MTVVLLEDTSAVLSLGKLREDDGFFIVVKKSHLTKNCKKISCKIANYVPFVVPSLSTTSYTPSSPDSSTSSSQDSVIGTENPATQRSEMMSEESPGKKSKTQINMKTTKNYEVKYCKMCRNGCRISKRIWWIRIFDHINTLPVLLMNFQWSREQKWYRVGVSTVSALTS